MVSYRKMYDRFAKEGRCGSFPNRCEEIYEFLKPKEVILDIGSGFGQNTVYLQQKGLDVIALDISNIALRKVKGFRVCADAQHLPFASNIFESVLCSEVLEHLPQPDMCIREVHRVLRRAGVAVFTTPALNVPVAKKIVVSFYGKLAITKKGRRVISQEGEHLRIFSTKELCNQIKQYLDVANVKHLGFTLLFQIKYGANKGRKLDAFISSLEETFPFLNVFATTVFVKAIKRVI